MFRNANLRADAPDDPVIFIPYKYILGRSWEECGVSKVDGYLSALGFSTPQEVTKFCDAVNVTETFSTEDWARRYTNAGDREIIAKFGKAASPNKIVWGVNLPQTASVIEKRTSYADFFQVLFTWVTGGDSAEARNRFIKFWENPSGGVPYNSGMRNPNHVMTGSISCRRSFKDAVTAFLTELRSPKPKAEAESWAVNAAHALRQKLIGTVLQKSNWGYISGTAANASISAGKFLSVGGGGGGFAVFDNNFPTKIYPLMTASGGVGVGAGVALPVSVTVDPADMPSKGTIYDGLAGKANHPSSFCGSYIAIAAGVAATIFNQTSSLMIIAPIYSLPILTADTRAAALSAVIPFSTAILALDGHGIEVGFGGSLQMSCGVIGPQRQGR